jgi:hypothetical protein
VALHIDPPDREFIEELGGRTAKVRAADVGPERRIVRDGIQQLAHGAMVCPSCRVPLVVPEPLPAGRQIGCGFCNWHGPARNFLVRDVYDTVANEVYLIARVA